MNFHFSFRVFKKTISVRIGFVLLFLLLTGTFIRVYGLTYTGLWLDEIFSMKGADPSTTISDVYQYSLHDQPPLFFMCLHAWLKVFGYTDFAGRTLAIVFGLSGIAAIYYLGTEFKGKIVGIFAAFLTTISWFHVSVSIEIRFYALVFLLTTLSYLFFLRAIKHSRFLDFAGYALFTAMLLNTHYFGMVVFATQALIFILIIAFYKWDSGFVIKSLFSAFMAGLSLLHWLPVILQDLQIMTFHIKPHTLRYLIKIPWWFFYDPAVFFTSIFLFIVGVWKILRELTEKSFSQEKIVLIGWIVLGFGIPLIYSLVRMPLFTSKYLTIQVPAMFVFIAYGFDAVRNAKVRRFIVTAMSVSAIVVLLVARPPYKKSWHEDGREMAIMYITMDESDSKTWNEDWREVANFFGVDSSKNQVIFSQLAWFHEYYFKKNNLRPPLDQNVVKDFIDATNQADSVWLLMHNHYTGGWPTNGFSPDQKLMIERGFDLVDSVQFRLSKAFFFKRKHDFGI